MFSLSLFVNLLISVVFLTGVATNLLFSSSPVPRRPQEERLRTAKGR